MILVDCNSLSFVFRITAYIFNIMMYIIPIALILLVTIDVAKMVINPDEKNKKDNMSKIAKRVMYALIIFLVPAAVKLLFRTLGNNNPSGYESNSWVSCFNQYFK